LVLGTNTNHSSLLHFIQDPSKQQAEPKFEECYLVVVVPTTP